MVNLGHKILGFLFALAPLGLLHCGNLESEASKSSEKSEETFEAEEPPPLVRRLEGSWQSPCVVNHWLSLTSVRKEFQILTLTFHHQDVKVDTEVYKDNGCSESSGEILTRSFKMLRTNPILNQGRVVYEVDFESLSPPYQAASTWEVTEDTLYLGERHIKAEGEPYRAPVNHQVAFKKLPTGNLSNSNEKGRVSGPAN